MIGQVTGDLLVQVTAE